MQGEANSLRDSSVQQHYDAGVSQHRLGKLDEAERHYRAVLQLQRDHPGVLHNLALVLIQTGRLSEAAEACQKIIVGAPDDAEAHACLGQVLCSMERYEEALVHLKRSVALKPDYAKAYANLGESLSALGLPAEALETFEKLLVLEPENAWANFGAGNAQRILGRLDEARRFYERAIALAPGISTFHRPLVEMKRIREEDPQLIIIEDLAQRIALLPQNEQIELHFALAKAYDDLGRYEAAFEHLQSGNVLKRRQVVYDEASQLGALRNIEAAFTPELIAARRGLGHPSDLPIFIVGMPRSGTTLVEQMLASHPRVFGGGELLYTSDVIASAQAAGRFPFDFALLSDKELHELGSLYLARLRPLAPSADRLTDKLPFNFGILGLIYLVLPKARIIHLRRHPVDTCFSCYANLFSHGIEFSNDLGELGRYYSAYQRLMAHWRRVLPQGTMLEVQYEELVADFETQSRRIVDYCGLEWDAHCLLYHQTKRVVRTASAAQVRQPLFKSSIGRWLPYKKQLQPLLDALEAEPAIDGG